MGGLVQFDGSDVCISTLVEFMLDDLVSASLFEWLLLTLLTLVHQTEKTLYSFSKAIW